MLKRSVARLIARAIVILSALGICTGCFSSEKPFPKSWTSTLTNISTMLCDYVQAHNQFPYDARGPEFALYQLIQNIPYPQRYLREAWGSEYWAFQLDEATKRVVDMKVEYWNTPELMIAFHSPPCVLLVLQFQPDKPKTLRIIGTDINVYEIEISEDSEPIPEARVFLGQSLVDLTAKYKTRIFNYSTEPYSDLKIENRGEGVYYFESYGNKPIPSPDRSTEPAPSSERAGTK